jgi:hypothetical protein
MLPVIKPEPAPDLKFIRDGMSIDDIKGTHTSEPKEWNNRNTLNVKDIQDVKSFAKSNSSQQSKDNISVSDIRGACPLKLRVG